MANELNYFGELSETGLTVTAKIYNEAGTQTGGDVSCTESGALAIYIGSMPAIALGEYGVRFFDSNDNLLGTGSITWDGTKEVSRQAIIDILEGDVIPTANLFEIKHKTTKAVLVPKTATVINGLTQLIEPI